MNALPLKKFAIAGLVALAALLFVVGIAGHAHAQPAAAPAAAQPPVLVPSGAPQGHTRPGAPSMVPMGGAQKGRMPAGMVPGHPPTAPSKAGAVAEGAANSSDLTTAPTDYGDLAEGSGTGMAVLFWIFALACVGGAAFVISRRNLVTAVMGMVGTFLAIAAVYMMLYASFLAVIQVLVYAGAIMVLFVFVIMILNKPEEEPFALTGRAGKGIAVLSIAYLTYRLFHVLWTVTPTNLKVATLAPALTAEGHAWGSTKAVGTALFGDGLFPFEAISILLLIAVVGAIAVARPLKDDENDADPSAPPRAPETDGVPAAGSQGASH